MIVEIERHDDRNENGWKFHGELVQPNPRENTWKEFPNMSVQVSIFQISPEVFD
jgi:hypothetical protein